MEFMYDLYALSENLKLKKKKKNNQFPKCYKPKERLIHANLDFKCSHRSTKC